MSLNFKVLQVIPKLGYGGAETGCYDIAHYLPENNCESFIVTSGGELTKFIDKKKVKLIRLPVHSKNPILILLNTIILIGIILFYNISIIHARSRAPAWSCLVASKLTGRKFVTTFHGTYNFSGKLKKFYNSVMVRSDLIIAGSNFIFSHIKENYASLIDIKKKFLVIFRGINVDYFDPSTKLETDEDRLLKNWEIKKDMSNSESEDLTITDLDHVLKLARLTLSDTEKPHYLKTLQDVLGTMKLMDQQPLDHVMACTHAAHDDANFRNDVVVDYGNLNLNHNFFALQIKILYFILD